MKISPALVSDNTLILIKPSGSLLSLKLGDIVKAEVVNILSSDTISLRLIPKDGKKEIIVSKTNIPLNKGDNILLKVTGGDGEVRLQFLGIKNSGNMSGPLQSQQSEDVVPLFKLQLNKDTETLNSLRELINSMPTDIKANLREFKTIENLLHMYAFLSALDNRTIDENVFLKKNRGNEDDSYTCSINLDLERLGRLSFSVTMFDKAFYISFYSGGEDVRAAITAEKGPLERRFMDAGLSLKAINITQRTEAADSDDVNIKV
ncbi:MAG: hypothetical protein HY756_03405 [Nitrospirae bacterium]|nr:hypothetical protein [Nitrospirota bacterium]